MKELGKFTQIADLREMWKHEERDFSPWLAKDENLQLLSKSVGIDIEPIRPALNAPNDGLLSKSVGIDIELYGLESPVGSYSADLFASQQGTGKKIIIENQLTDTDHDHLGKLITYAAGKSATIIIWIAKKARKEHREAIEWLNKNTSDGIDFLLVEIELWKIDDSKPAVRFNLVESPDDWATRRKTSSQPQTLSETNKLQLAFWEAFSEYAYKKDAFTSVFKGRRKASPQSWYELSVGTTKYCVQLSISTRDRRLDAGIYSFNNKELAARFLDQDQKKAIEQSIGFVLEVSEGEKDCRIFTSKEGDIKEQSAWPQLFDWFCDAAIRFKEMTDKFGV